MIENDEQYAEMKQAHAEGVRVFPPPVDATKFFGEEFERRRRQRSAEWDRLEAMHRELHAWEHKQKTIDFRVVRHSSGQVLVDRPDGSDGTRGLISPPHLADTVVWPLWQSLLDAEAKIVALLAERLRGQGKLAEEQQARADAEAALTELRAKLEAKESKKR